MCAPGAIGNSGGFEIVRCGAFESACYEMIWVIRRQVHVHVVLPHVNVCVYMQVQIIKTSWSER